jgi:SET domain-containing protein
MKPLPLSDKVYLADSAIPGAGRGVFAKIAISEGEVIETCPVIELPRSDAANDDNGKLTAYFFYFGDGLAMVLGFGSLYNHSYHPNATYLKRVDDGVVEFVALKDIPADTEITTNYNNGDPDDQTPIKRGVPDPS